MPFPLRTLEPLKLCRLEEAGGDGAERGGPAPGDHAGAAEGGSGRRRGAVPLFGTLEQVSSYALVSLLMQLSDLSRCAGDIFGGILSEADSLCHRNARLQRRLGALEELLARLDHRKVKIPVSNLDEESRWTVHYTAPWHQQENVFLPSSRPPCVEDLHRQAKLNLKSVLRECDKLRRDGYRSSQYYSQGPTFSSSSSAICGSYQDDYEEIEQKSSLLDCISQSCISACCNLVPWSNKCPVSTPEEEKLITIKRPKSPATNELSDINTQTNWTKSLPLPTPEEKMRQQAQAVQTDVVPINVTGENFDRQASIRRSLIYTDTVVRRPKKVKRRKTITGIPDNIQKELAVGTGQSDFRGHSMYVPDHCSTLGRLDSYRSAMQRSETKDTSCQTEEVKVVPPSMRRIRAQKGQGIAAQMSQFSSSSGNMSVMSDSAAVIFASRQNNDIGFHSLPRIGARVSLQSLDETQSMMSRQTEDIAGTLPHQISKLQVDDSVVHLRNNPMMGTPSRPKSQEVRSCDSEKSSSPACVVSPHATYSTSIIPNATLSSSSEVILIHAAQSVGSLDSKMSSSTAFPNPRDNPAASSAVSGKEDHHSSSGNWSESSSTRHSQTSDTIPSNTVMMLSLGDSAVSLSTPGNAEAGSQSMSYSCRNTAALASPSQDSDGRSESSYSGERAQAAVSSTEHWLYKSSENSETPSRKVVCTPGCATPGSNLSSSSLERTSGRDDSTSLYSVDHDGYYGSMHMESRLKTDMPCNSTNGFENPRDSVINVFEGKEKKLQDDHSGQGDKSLARNISLKKAKKPPLPPSRTDSLRRMPKKKAQSNGQILDETLIATLQHSLQLNLKCKNGSSPSQSPCSDYEDPWVLRSRSQSSVSASSSMMSTTAPNLYSICTVTPSQSETSSIKSEYADQWGYYSDYAAVADDQVKSPVTHSASTSSALSDYSISHFSDGSRASVPQVPSGLAKPKSASPEKSHRVTSPSSGYSSQSNTPTALTPVPVLVKSASSGNGKSKLKPKVPERKSSLLSSVSMSSSSTSLSSNTSTEGSVSVKKLDPALSPPLDSGAPPPPPPLPTSQHCPELSPLPPPPPAEVMDLSPLSTSPTFPPPPPEASVSSTFAQTVPWFPQEASISSFSSPVPPPPSCPLAVPPPAPPLDPKITKGAAIYPQYSFKKRNQEDSCYSPVKQPLNKQDSSRPVMPLVTTKALQMVQLRSVKKSTEGESSTESASETTSQEKGTVNSSSQSLLKPSLSLKLTTSLGDEEVKTQGASFKNAVQTLSRGSPLILSDNTSVPDSDQKPVSTVGLKKSEGDALGSATDDDTPESSVQSEDLPSGMLLQGSPASPDKTQVVLPSKKPPPVSKKPKLFLLVPPPQLDLTVEKAAEVSDTARSPTKRDAVHAHSEEVRNCLTDGLGSNEMDSGSLVPEGGAAGFTFSATVGANVFVVQPAASPVQEEPRQEEQSAFDEGSSSGSSQDSGSNADGHLSQENESVEVFESDTASSSFLPSSSYGEETDGVATPARPRTTEDLFAAIHRSKRKVLGRKDSEDDRTRNHSPSPPVTPTGASPNLATLKQAGSIQRSVRKSSTSNDNFKALLLKKGSRCDTSSRMSAAEMLKNTDPRFHRTKTDAPADLSDGPASCSPSKSKRAQEEWAKSEGLMPRSMSFSGTRYGRSRTPPSAASSKYNVRNRIQSSPMTVISEGDGEVVEQSEGRVRRTLEEQQEGQLDMFNSDEMDMNDFPYAEEAGCKETLDPAHVDLMTQPGASRKYLNSSAEES
ncbi:NHS-like protein 1 isoform X1 [Motacilla alba alba]|uniref:NHS-like protein 1 isoform X1 n=1 Tax=Motacilla alba alba TaxID=1094192 RepID=UPI0018D58DD7|nr:NHS-like protein 1 isoform X1 [Motacilla alba alba]